MWHLTQVDGERQCRVGWGALPRAISTCCPYTTLFIFFYKIPFFVLLSYLQTKTSKTIKEKPKNKISISKMGVLKRRVSSSRGLGGVLREQRAKLYIIKRCVVMLLCWQDWSWLLQVVILRSWTGLDRWLLWRYRGTRFGFACPIVDLGGWKLNTFDMGICF